MTEVLRLRCSCGEVQGQVTMGPVRALHAVCYCDDCRAFARAIERSDLLDEWGGSELMPTAPAQVKLASGHAQVRCLRLSPVGMLRFSSACCRTPLANLMAKPGMPFASLHRAFIDVADAAVLGPLRRMQGRFATTTPPAGTSPSASVSMIAQTLRLLTTTRVRGLHRPNPFFNGDDVIVTPRVLTPAERDALRD